MDKRTYILMRAPQSPDGNTAREIKIIDNTDKLGKRRVEKLVAEEYEYVGKISDTELTPIGIQQGISARTAFHRDTAYRMINQIREIIDA